jgi:hypothetical protein
VSDYVDTIQFRVPQDSTIPTAINNLELYASFQTVMFVFDNSEDLDIATYEYRLYTEDQVDPDPVNAGYFILNGNVSINSGTITPYRQGFNLANVFTVSVENSTTTSTTSTTSAVSYYGAIRAIDTSGNVGPWTLITETDTDTPLIDEEFIGSLTAAKITTGTIGAAEITLNGSNSIIKSSGYLQGQLGWKITGNGDAEFNELTVRTALDIGGSDTSSFHVDIDGNLWLGASTYGSAPFRISNTGNVDVGGTDASSFHIDKDGNIWSGAETFNTATNPFSVTAAGALRASSVTITNPVVTTPAITGGSISGTSLDIGTGTSSFHVDTSGNLWSGASTYATAPFKVSNTGNVDVGSTAVADVSSFHIDNTGNIWSGAETFNATTNPFAVTAAGAIKATSGRIGPVLISSSSMNSQGSSPYLNSNNNYYGLDNFGDIYIYSNPGSDVGGPHVNQFHSTALVGEYIQIKKTSTSAFSDNLYEARIGDTSGTYAEVVVQNASTSSYVAMYSTGNVTLTGSLNGYSFTSGRHNGANQMVHTDGNGYLQVGYINSSNGNEGNNSNPSRVWGTNGSDDYLRSYLTSALSVGSAGYATSAGSATSATTAGRLVSTTNNSIDTTGLYPSSVVEPLSIKQNDASGQNTISYRNESNTLLMYVTDTGNVRGTGGYTNLSDRNSKENIVYVDKQILATAVNSLKPATFNYIGTAEQHLGFIAQDVQEFLPDAVKQFDENRLGLDTNVIIAALVAKCQDLEARLALLETK